jgi:hypothetical protein
MCVGDTGIAFPHVENACLVCVCGTHIVNTTGLSIPPCQPTFAETSYHDAGVIDVEVTYNHDGFLLFPHSLLDDLQTVPFDGNGGCSVLSAAMVWLATDNVQVEQLEWGWGHG